jgi:hypothetical protein
MKKIIFFLITTAIATMAFGQDKFCDPTLAEEVNNYTAKNGGVWLKDFDISLQKYTANNPQPEAKYSIVLSADYVYRFLLISSLKYPGDAQLSIEDKAGKLIAVLNTKSKNIPEAYDLDIKTTDSYSFIVNFKDKNEGCANFTICYLKKKN